MKKRFVNPSARLAGAGDETRSFIVMLGISALCHLLLLGMFYVVPPSSDRSFRAGPRTIDVDLVSLPAAGPSKPAVQAPPPSPPKPKPEVAKPEPVPAAPPPVVKKEQVSIAPQKKKPKVVKSLKKKTIAPKTAPARVTRPTPKEKKPQRTQKVDSAIEAMRKKVAGQEQARSAAGGTGAGAGVLDRTRNYKIDVGLSVGRNFAFPQQLARSTKDLATLITFRVLPNGEIIDVKIYKSSGNSQLDEAAYRAVLKSNPVKPHPEGLMKPYIEVGLRCTPAGVQ